MTGSRIPSEIWSAASSRRAGSRRCPGYPILSRTAGISNQAPAITADRAWNVTGCSACSCLRRSEEHTSELQSHHDLVCRLLLEKKTHKKKQKHKKKTKKKKKTNKKK